MEVDSGGDFDPKVGITTGAGFDFIIDDRFTIGAEYHFGFNKTKETTIYVNNCNIKNIKTNSF